jgi:hypothetical protein
MAACPSDEQNVYKTKFLVPASDRCGQLHASAALPPAKEPSVLHNKKQTSFRSHCTYWATPHSVLRLHTQNSGHKFWSTCSSVWGVSASSVCGSRDRPSLGITLRLVCSTPGWKLRSICCQNDKTEQRNLLEARII